MTKYVLAPPQYDELLDREPALDPFLEEPVEIALTPKRWRVLHRVYWDVLNSARYQRDRPGRDRWGVWRWARVQGLFRKLWLRHGDVVLDSLIRGVWMRGDSRFDRYQWIDREEPGDTDWVSMAPAPTLEDLARRAG